MGPKQVWDADADRNLFLAILKLHPISINYEAVANELSSPGNERTGKAIQMRMAKLRSMSGSTTGSPGVKSGKRGFADDDDVAAHKTKPKNKQAKTSPKKSIKQADVDDDLSDAGGEETVSGMEQDGLTMVKEEVKVEIED